MLLHRRSLSTLIVLALGASGAAAFEAPALSSCQFEAPFAATPWFGRGLHDRATMPLDAKESIVFLGIAGNYGSDGAEALAVRLAEDFGLRPFGPPARSYSDRDRLVWALRTTDPDKVENRLSRALKKTGFQVTRLRASGLALDGTASLSTIKRVVRDLEFTEKRLWGSSIHMKEDRLWLFHEEKLDSRSMLKSLRAGSLSPDFFHQEIQLGVQDGADLKLLAEEAYDRLDLVRSAEKEREQLVLDLYFRDLDTFMALKSGDKIYACADLTPFLKKSGGKLKWEVTLDNEGFPFED